MNDRVKDFTVEPPPRTNPFTEHVKRTTQGKLAAATQVQSAEYLKPLFKALRSRVRTTVPTTTNITDLTVFLESPW